MHQNMEKNNTKTLYGLLGLLGLMIGLVAASVPLYQIFCQVTGYGGTTQRAEAIANAGEAALTREMTVSFNADVNKSLPWSFKPVQRTVKVKVGEEALIYYRAENKGTEPVTGTAVFNVTPFKTAMYFNKIECFCFTEQTLAPGEVVDMPVTFFIDPDIVNDKNQDEIVEMTLSYTFYPADEE